MQRAPVHKAVRPLSWLIGHWKSISAEIFYPTMEPVTYCEELVFESFGQPLLNYHNLSWHPIRKTPMHLERGFLRVNPGTNDVAFMIAHSLGANTLEEGTICEDLVDLKTVHVGSMTFMQLPQVLGLERRLRYVEGGHLEVELSMATCKTPMTPHLKAIYQRCE